MLVRFTFVMLCLAFVTSTIKGQYTFTLKIKDTQGMPLKNVEVKAVNDEADVSLTQRTDVTGTTIFVLTTAGEYKFSYLENTNFHSISIVERMMGKASKTTTYDPEKFFAVQPNANRTGLVFKTSTALQLKGTTNVAKVAIEVKEKNSTRVTNLPIEVVDIKAKVKYQGVTNGSGVATFYLPVNNEYEIDIAGIEGIQKVKVPNYPNAELSETVYYEKTKVTEEAKGDTIVQKQVTQTNGTTTHLLFSLNLKNYEGLPCANEPVYINDKNGKRVYVGKTDDKGMCKFMLEKGTQYLINLKYERDIALVDASNTLGFAFESITRRYRGSAAIEKMMEERKMNALGFVVNHSETPVKVASKPSDYLTKTTDGFTVQFKNSGPIGTPTVVEDQLFTQAGFYSPSFYCLNALNGQFIWGVELGESGASPAVYHNGVLLINTYSCTLYALEANTGKMLWSKWLAGTIYSTPSADENSVYVVYDNGGSNPKNPDEDFVLASFDLKTGKMNWITWLDSEVIACPVVEGGNVHVASHSGTYYVFDKKTGKEVTTQQKINALSSPTISANSIFITVETNGKEQVLVLDKTTYKVVRKYAPANAFKSNKIVEQKDAYAQMNFNGSHPIVYKNKYVVIVDANQVITFDATTEREIWRKPISAHASQVPIVANDQIVVATQTGELVSFDIKTGTSKKLVTGKGAFDGQPVAHKGLYYLGSAGVLMVIKAIQQFQWNQWNKDAQHNLNIE